MSDYALIGKSVRNVDAYKKVTGGSIYTDDLKLPGMLHGKILRSKYPHARILNIDVSKAKRLAGVKAVITGKDIPPYLYGVTVKDKPVFAIDRVRYMGDEVAGVVAVDRDTAEDAIDLIEVEYEELPSVFDPVEAMKEGTPLIHEKLREYECVPIIRPIPNTNICGYFKLRRGNMEAGFKQADTIFEDEFKAQPVSNACLEPIACIADVDSQGNVTVWSSNQSPYVLRDHIAGTLKIPASRVRVIVPFVGGGFGVKYFIKGELACVMMSQFVGKPVKLVYTREELFTAATLRQPLLFRIKTGVKKDGAIVARQCTLIWNTGAYSGLGPQISRNAAMTASGPYHIPNVWVDSYTVYTNNTMAGAFRGLGVPQVAWAVESHTDILAEQLKMDPLEFRLKNAVEEGSILPTGQVAQAVGLKECLLILEEKGYSSKKEAKEKYTGVGVACGIKSTGTPTSSCAFIKLNPDASADVIGSSVDMGQGCNTVLSQIASEELGIPVEKINISMPDTFVTPFDQATVGSRTTFHMGNAIKMAAQDVKRELFNIASGLLGVGVSELELREGKVWVKGSSEKFIPLEKLPMGGRYVTRIGYPVIGKGFFSAAREGTVLDLETGQGSASSIFWMYGAALVEIEINPETGEVKIKNIVEAHNVGKAINPALLEGQFEGGVVMGIGAALYEDVIWEKGRTLNPNLTDYKLPAFTNIPPIESVFVEVPHPEAPYGNIGIGEAVTICTPPAIANALYRAVGVRIKDLPITAEKVLKALKEKGGKE
jgi:carbon-monoxide dehydrogenase large subunit